MGIGSMEISVDATGVELMSTNLLTMNNSVFIRDLEQLSLSIYVDSRGQLPLLPTFQFQCLQDITVTSSQSIDVTLVYAPETTDVNNWQFNTWYSFDFLAGNLSHWYIQSSDGSVASSICSQTSPCNISTILSTWNNIGLQQGAIISFVVGNFPQTLSQPYYYVYFDQFTYQLSGQACNVWSFEPMNPASLVSSNPASNSTNWQPIWKPSPSNSNKLDPMHSILTICLASFCFYLLSFVIMGHV
jgi:hypothetical protein